MHGRGTDLVPLGSSSFAPSATKVPGFGSVVVLRPSFAGSFSGPWFDLWSPFPDEPAPATDAEMSAFSTEMQVSAAGTYYIGPGGVSSSESVVEFPMVAGVCTKLAALDEVVGGTRVYTLRKNGADTALTVTLSGSTQTASVTGSVTFADGDRASIKLVKSAGAQVSRHAVSLKHAPA